MAIQGTVTAAREPVVVLETLPKKRKISVIIDTGFSGELCLPPRTIHNMGFERFRPSPRIISKLCKVSETKRLGSEDPIWSWVGKASDGKKDVSTKHDRYLAEGERKRWRR